MLLDRRHPADAFVVGEGLVVDRDQADNFGFAALAQDLDAEVPVEQVEALTILDVARYRRGLDDADFGDRRGDLAVLDRLAHGRRDLAQRHDRIDRHPNGRLLEPEPNRDDGALRIHADVPPPRRDAIFSGKLSSFSALMIAMS